MEHRSSFPQAVLFPPPDTDEAAALAVAARYLAKAGTAAVRRLLGLGIDQGELALAEALRDSLMSGATLCAGVLDLAPRRTERR